MERKIGHRLGFTNDCRYGANIESEKLFVSRSHQGGRR